MRIAYLTPSVSRSAGGIFEIERRLAQSLAERPDIQLITYGPSDEFSDDDLASWHPLVARTFPSYGPSSFRWSPQLSRAFVATSADVAHLHVLWMYTSLVMRRWSRRHGKPFVTTLHGMLDPWALRNSRWKKRLSALAYEQDCLRRAACIQAGSQGELVSARSFGLKNPICVIPNGIDIPNATGASPPWNQKLRDKKVLLYLGRLHPKKGLVNLLAAWRNLRARSHPKMGAWSLVIAGWSQVGHVAQLRDLAKAYALEDDVTFAGPLYDGAKSAAYEHSHAVVLPSYSEGLPMSVLEAWSHRKPVLMTPQCNLPEGFAAGAAIEAQPEEQSLTEGLARLFDSNDEDLSCMGARGLDLVTRKFTWAKVADEMLSVYRWLVGGGAAPSCVVH